MVKNTHYLFDKVNHDKLMGIIANKVKDRMVPKTNKEVLPSRSND
jgi:hypothetical protein